MYHFLGTCFVKTKYQILFFILKMYQMKGKHFMLTAIAMLCWVAATKAAITSHYENGDLIVHTDQWGVAGYKGCDATHLKRMPAYILKFRYQNKIKKGV